MQIIKHFEMETKELNFNITKAEKSRIDQLDPQNIVFGSLFTDHMLVADYANGEWQAPQLSLIHI